MCQVCGCTEILKKGRRAAQEKAIEIIQRLGVTPENASLFEDGERICAVLGPKVSLAPERSGLWDTVKTVCRFHEGNNEEKYRAAEAAARDVFSHLPAKGDPLEIITLWHQLERLHREFSDTEISALPDAKVRDALLVMRHVHDGSDARKAELIEKYHL